MASIKERLTSRFEKLRADRPFVDHLARWIKHFGEVKGTVQAGAVTFFGFLSFFPILALAFFVIGYVAQVYPDAQAKLQEAIESVLPGLIGTEDGQISLQTFQDNASTIGLIGLFGVLYSGLGWLSGMREALLIMFAMPAREKPNFLVGKARDLVVLGIVGVTLVVSVALSGAVTGFSESILGWLGILHIFGVPVLVMSLGYLLAILATTALFMVLFRLLARPDLPRKAQVQGAVLGALGFEVLKFLANVLIESTQQQPAFAVFGISLILLVWINYFSRVTMYAAAWAYTSPLAVEARAAGFVRMPGAALARSSDPESSARGKDPAAEGHRKTIVAGGALAGLGVAGAVAALRKRRSHAP